jgi:hypothetical protein
MPKTGISYHINRRKSRKRKNLKNKGVNMHCDNCGHNAHCGVPLYEDAEDGVTGESYKYEICKHCRCNDCTPLDYGN